MRHDAKRRDWLMTGLTAIAIVTILFAAGKVANISADAAAPYSLLISPAE